MPFRKRSDSFAMTAIHRSWYKNISK